MSLPTDSNYSLEALLKELYTAFQIQLPENLRTTTNGMKDTKPHTKSKPDKQNTDDVPLSKEMIEELLALRNTKKPPSDGSTKSYVGVGKRN
jgi:hypothetical protein